MSAVGSGPVGVGVIGAGSISDEYLSNLHRFPDIELLAVGDLDPARAARQAERFGAPVSGSAADVLATPGVEIVLNLTVPVVHAEVSAEIIRAGKHVWSEKPLALDRRSGAELLRAADLAGVRIGVAPDTILGPGIQSARRAIESGMIGRLVSARTVMQWEGPETFHENPAFLYSRGGGPLFDMGPYYVATLVSLFGSVDSVSAMGTAAAETRRVLQGPRRGQEFPVEVATTVAVLMRFASGAIAQCLFSFDAARFEQGTFEVSGGTGSLLLPDPNDFTGSIGLVRPVRELVEFPPVQEIEPVPVLGVVTGRGVGVLDLARAIRLGEPHIATGELGFHVLDVLVSIEEAMATSRHIRVESSCSPVRALPPDFDPLVRTVD